MNFLEFYISSSFMEYDFFNRLNDICQSRLENFLSCFFSQDLIHFYSRITLTQIS